METVRSENINEWEKLLYKTHLLLFDRKFVKQIGESCCTKFFEKLFNKFFVKAMENSTDYEENKVTAPAAPNQTIKVNSKVQSWF